MQHLHPALERRILSALAQAVDEGRLTVAEHLLSAIEALRHDCVPGSPLADAYRLIATKNNPRRH